MNRPIQFVSALLLAVFLALPLGSQGGSGGGGNRQVQIQIQAVILVAIVAFELVQSLSSGMGGVVLDEPGSAVTGARGKAPTVTDRPAPADVAKLDAVAIDPALPVPEALR